MLTIRTGIMGHGKTLNTIKEVDQQAVEESRPVYYHNVTDLDPSKLKGQWFEFEDPLKWYDLPENAIIVIDEAQNCGFRSHDPRKGVPEHLSRFELMRKGGHHVHLITQDPRFLDTHCRRLCTQHIHYLRIFGSQKLSRYEMQRVYETVEKITTFKDADFKIISLDKKFFGVYTSAKANHHFKFKPSKKFIIACVGLLFIGGIVFRAADRLYGDKEVKASSEPTIVGHVTDTANSAITGFLANAVPGSTDRQVPTIDYAQAHQPRLENLPSSAPIYDDLTKPQTFPRLNCLSSTDPSVVDSGRHPTGMYNGVKASCTCYTQQGTRISAGFQTCMNASQYGYFDHTLPDPASHRQASFNHAQQPQHHSSFSPPPQLEQHHETRVTVIPESRRAF
jgi:zona occludens toxin